MATARRAIGPPPQAALRSETSSRFGQVSRRRVSAGSATGHFGNRPARSGQFDDRDPVALLAQKPYREIDQGPQLRLLASGRIPKDGRQSRASRGLLHLTGARCRAWRRRRGARAMPLDWSGCGRIHPGPGRWLMNEKPLVDYRSVSNQYFARLKILLEGGRLVDSRDRFTTPW